VTGRDRMIIVVVLFAAALAGSWFVAIAPKRHEAADLQTKIAAGKQQLAAAQQQAAQARQAKARYDDDYAEVAKLGKAVPKTDALPSLLYQLQSVARGARIDFASLKIASGSAQAATPAAAAQSASGSGSSAAGTQSTSAAATPAAATQSASAGLPPGATVGSAGFPTMPFSFVFSGSFSDMQHLLLDIQRFVRVDGQKLDVRGRLLSVDGFALSAGPSGFPSVKANIAATAYLQSPGDSASSSAGAASASTPATATTSEVAR
jgi:hypothetical protein